ncbi:hypothetical protein [Hyunsoonleella pacifica]|uniref:Uncharacterized protein n=1 Tax=Hyunsoonleella pacifica TaxID=1080224 RepID=A0A4Q9FSN9_9FLAO|nr:hypothetical protein [Hyunsoonleella pacifica]TBN18710.1 hypothetical protein EYD46_01190 [Hyunsoonleella pacifica]GGD04065.1 hypothetical protein GCM10011368_02370 [Hyunsoonleella pacifica]
MKNALKIYLFLCIIVLIGCNSDDDSSQTNNLVSEFKINNGKTYLTPNGYYTKYEIEGKKDNFLLHFIDGKFVPITNPEEGIPCPWVENMTQGITIKLKSILDDEIAPGLYKYTLERDSTGIKDDAGVYSPSKVFYGFQLDNQCYSQTDEDLNITDGEMTINVDNGEFSITYSFTSENGVTIKGAYYGKLQKQLAPEW